MALHVIITIGNSYSKIIGLSVEQFKQLRELLSYQVNAQTSYFSGNFKNKRYLLSKTGEFPSGLLYLVESWIKKHQLNHIRKNKNRIPESIKDLHSLKLTVTPYPDQVDAVKAAVASNRCIIQMPTGSGKSITMAMVIAKLNVKTLVVVPNLELKRQLRESFTEIFGNLNNITIENIDSPALEKITNYDLLIIDEAHHSAAKTYRKLNKKQWAGIYYRYCFTATPFRSKDEEQLLMEGITGRVAYTLHYLDAVKRGYIVPLEAYYIEVPKSDTIGYSWAEVYSELVVNNRKRNELISFLIEHLHNTLCLVKEIAHGKILSDLTHAAFAHGEGDLKDIFIPAFSKGELTALIGTNGVLGEGVDTKSAEYVIIAGIGKSRPAFMQAVGRGLRCYPGKESCKVIIFLDKSHKWTKAHFNAQKKILIDEYGVLPVKLEI